MFSPSHFLTRLSTFSAPCSPLLCAIAVRALLVGKMAIPVKAGLPMARSAAAAYDYAVMLFQNPTLLDAT
jgi:hypothetical protein